MKNIEPKPIDVEYIDKELSKLFKSSRDKPYGPLFGKHRSRFFKQQREKENIYWVPDKNSMLSLGKKLEILCLYGGYTLVKLDRNKKH